MLLLFGERGRAAEAGTSVVVEVDLAAEQLVDARTLRRLIGLELADLGVPGAAGDRTAALFYRVLGERDGTIQLELWERGTLHGSRRISSADRKGLLFARRLALAAAELARGLRQQRLAQRRLELRRRARERAERRALLAATREGPLALRASTSAERGREHSSAGTGLTLGATLLGATRLDLGLRLHAGRLDAEHTRFGSVELSVGPAHRLPLTRGLELDVGASLGARLLHVDGARAVDAIAGQDETWTARAGLALRLEPRLSRSLRASVGVEGGTLLRRAPLTLATGDDARLAGPYAGLELGLVITPGRGERPPLRSAERAAQR